MACPDEITDCELIQSLTGVEMILKKLLRLNGDCLSIQINAAPQTEGTIESSVVSGGSGATIPAGALKIVFETDEDFEGNINGIARNASRMYTFEIPGKKLPAIIYTRTAGSFKLDIYS